MEILIGIAVLAVLVYVYTRFFAKPSKQDGVKPIVVPPTRPVDEVKVEVASVEVVTMAQPVDKAKKPAVKKQKVAKKPATAKTPAKTAKPKKPKMTVVK